MKADKTLVSALLLLMPLVGCGGDSGSSEAPATETATATPAAETAAPAEAPEMELPEGVTTAMVEEGEGVFTGDGVCYTCHGMNGEGGPLAPNLQDDEWIHIDGSYEQIVEQIMEGTPEPVQYPGIMLPKGGTTITDEQVRAVAAYVWTLSQGG